MSIRQMGFDTEKLASLEKVMDNSLAPFDRETTYPDLLKIMNIK